MSGLMTRCMPFIQFCQSKIPPFSEPMPILSILIIHPAPITNNRFETSGNDAIDLMGSSPQIIGNHITGAGDKGISVGEDSHPFVFNNYIARSQTGIGIKDRSEPFLFHNMITQNKMGINQYAKNWRYGSGGWGSLWTQRLWTTELILRVTNTHV